MRGLGNAMRLARARWRGARLGSHCQVSRSADLNPGSRAGRPGEIEIGAEVDIEQGAILWAYGGSIRLARRVFIGQHVVIYGNGGVDVGEYTLIAAHSCIVSSNHAVPPADRIIRNEPDVLLPTRIGRDVWLGVGVKVLGGVTIGDGCVVGAGAVVTRDLPAYSIAMGVPARITGERS
jgi:acetyltransferase-like isoleucine patch superfamily enzyme